VWCGVKRMAQRLLLSTVGVEKDAVASVSLTSNQAI
jgi:hypothetical protein